MSKKTDIKESFIPPLSEEEVDSSLLIFKEKSKNVESSKLTDSETVSESVEMLQTQVNEFDEKLVKKFQQLKDDGFSSSEIMECLQIDRELFKKLNSLA